MSKSPKSTTAPVSLAGLTAVQIRELIDTKQVTAKAAVEFLVAKEAAHRLRAPAKKLLGELTGAAPAKAAEPKPAAAKPAAAKPAKPAEPVTPDLAAIIGKAVAGALAPVLARLDAVEAKLSAAPKPEAKPVAKAAEPKPVAKAAEPKPVAKAAEPVETMSEAEARAEFQALKLSQLREIADFECNGMSKAEVIDEMIAGLLDEGVVIAAVPVKAAKPAPAKAGKPDLKVVAREVAVEF